MTRILVTGGNGGLGREVVPLLQKADYTVRVMSRQARPATLTNDLEWATADIGTGSGLKEAVADVDEIINAASSPRERTQEVDVAGTRKLVEAAELAKVKHFIHVSIVGIDRIPYPYYTAKVGAEEQVKAGHVPFTILRATQFHTLIDAFILAPYRNWPVALAPLDFKFQPIDTGEVAQRIANLVGQAAAGLLPDMGGPEVLTVGQMATAWFVAQGKHCWLLPIYVPGGFANALRNGYNTCPEHKDGDLTWGEWLKQKYKS
jgi:uncharacterized protein YbjT (DUF2867 family)